MNVSSNIKPRESGDILGVSINSTSKERVLRQIVAKVQKKQSDLKSEPLLVVTPNPEIILRAQDDPELKDILNNADISIPDGSGLLLAQPSLELIKGRELFIDIVSLANKNGWKLVFIGGLDGASAKAAEFLYRGYKHLNVLPLIGPKLNNSGLPVSESDVLIQSEMVRKINEFEPDIVIVGFGAPKQEKWSFRWKKNMDTKVIMVVGGAFDYYSGKLRLPPKVFSNLGLEWLWRLINQPSRIGRIWNAVIIFPLRIFISKLQNHY